MKIVCTGAVKSAVGAVTNAVKSAVGQALTETVDSVGLQPPSHRSAVGADQPQNSPDRSVNISGYVNTTEPDLAPETPGGSLLPTDKRQGEPLSNQNNQVREKDSPTTATEFKTDNPNSSNSSNSSNSKRGSNPDGDEVVAAEPTATAPTAPTAPTAAELKTDNSNSTAPDCSWEVGNEPTETEPTTEVPAELGVCQSQESTVEPTTKQQVSTSNFDFDASILGAIEDLTIVDDSDSLNKPIPDIEINKEPAPPTGAPCLEELKEKLMACQTLAELKKLKKEHDHLKLAYKALTPEQQLRIDGIGAIRLGSSWV